MTQLENSFQLIKPLPNATKSSSSYNFNTNATSGYPVVYVVIRRITTISIKTRETNAKSSTH